MWNNRRSSADVRSDLRRPRFTRQAGVILVPFIIGMVTIVTLLGALTESSLILHARHKMANGAESALLAACNLYNTGNYNQSQLNSLIQNTYSANNFLNASNTSLDFSQIGSGILILSTSNSVNSLFLKKNLTVQSTVAATIPLPASAVSGIAPIAVEVFPYVIGTSYIIKDGGGGGSNGNFGALSLSGNGASDYEYDFINGYSGTISIGQSLPTKPGNMNGPTEDAVTARLAAGNGVILVVMTNDAPQGRDQITVAGFAAFKLISVDNKGAITGKFINYKTAATGSSSATAYGVYAKPKLIYY